MRFNSPKALRLFNTNRNTLRLKVSIQILTSFGLGSFGIEWIIIPFRQPVKMFCWLIRIRKFRLEIKYSIDA